VRSGGFGATLAEAASGSGAADANVVILGAFEHLRTSRTLAGAASAAQKPDDLSQLSASAESARDAARASSRKWATATAGSVGGAITVALAASVIGAPVALALGVVVGAAVAAYFGYLYLEDAFEHDGNAEEYVKTATDYAAWFVSQGLPFPHFRPEIFRDAEGYADALKKAANSIIGHPADLREAVLRAGADFLDAGNEDIVVQAMFLTGGEQARQWAFWRGSWETIALPGWGVVTDREGWELFTAAIGTSTASKHDLPALHVQAVIDAARQGWDEGAMRGVSDGHFHPGIVAMAHAKIAAENAAAAWRAQIDAVIDAYPAAAILVGGSAINASISSTSGLRSMIRSSILYGGNPAAPSSGDGGTVPQEAVDALKPPPPATSGPSTSTIVAGVVVTSAIGFLVSSAGAALRRRLFGF
jgi:hypothetical protein